MANRTGLQSKVKEESCILEAVVGLGQSRRMDEFSQASRSTVRNFPFLDQAKEKEFWQDKLQVVGVIMISN